MIDTLFGSKTRVKLLHLFFNNPGKSFYVREITRLIDEQINSVRRELSNLLEVGVIISDSVDNKLYYEVDKSYTYYNPFYAIFADDATASLSVVGGQKVSKRWREELNQIAGIRVGVIAGNLVVGSASPVDLLLVGNIPQKKISSLISHIEKEEMKELNYSVLTYDEFYYRLSIRDKFLMSIIGNKHEVIVDHDNILKVEKE